MRSLTTDPHTQQRSSTFMVPKMQERQDFTPQAAHVWVGRKQIDWRYFLVSVVLAALVSSPLFIGMLSGDSH